MSLMSEWKAISNRIEGLAGAAQFFVQFQQQDSRGSMKRVLLPQIEKIYGTIKQYHETYKTLLSPNAQECIANYLALDEEIVRMQADQDHTRVEKLKRLVTSLISFKSELDFHLSDAQFTIQRITERAFVHLQRLIVVDKTIQNKWENGFKLETECEKLGAAHLLFHGIWAFKAHAEKGRTDLILGEPINLNQVEETSEGLVLTEWKLVKDAKDIKEKASEAYSQAKNYSGGMLAGIELRSYRYLVLVSEKQLTLPEDIVEGEIVYKYINIAISPDVPSMVSKQHNVK